MRVLILSSTYHPVVGGVQIVTHNLAQHLIKNGHEVLVVTNHYPRSLPIRERLNGVSVERLLFLTPGVNSLKRGRADLFLASFYFYPYGLWRLRKIMRSFQPDVVNVHFPDQQIPFVLALRRMFGVRLVVSLHGHDIERVNDNLAANENVTKGLPPQRSELGRLRSILLEADVVTACSQYLLEKAIRFEPSIRSKGRVIHNGIDLTRFRNKTAHVSSRPYVLCLGRLVRAKGFDMLLDAFAQVESEKTDLIIAGDGEERSTLENQARVLGLEGRIQFFGPATPEQAVSLLNGCSLVVIPSRSESFGIVALEALAAGKPILATSVGGLGEILSDVYKRSGNGISASPTKLGGLRDIATVEQGVMLVAPNVEALANGLSKALHSGTRENRSEPQMDHYQWERVGHEYEAAMMS